ncbi:MAG: peptide chain release factor 3, partial [Actinobacteria bacterium]|nr:peptide chain release factor 3 [Actinomycetota bacterium]
MAAQAEDIKRLKERLEGHLEPVLSVYLSVNARIPENQGQAYKVRLKDALREMEEVPEELAGRVRESVEHQVHQHARTLVFFAAGDELFERYELQLDLPEAYRFGEPYLAPLVLGLDEHESYGVALV